MTCFFCKGNMIDSKTNYFLTLDSGMMVIIKNVPCHRCAQCGEISYDGEVAAQLERIVETMKNAIMEVAIVNYPDKVA